MRRRRDASEPGLAEEKTAVEISPTTSGQADRARELTEQPRDTEQRCEREQEDESVVLVHGSGATDRLAQRSRELLGADLCRRDRTCARRCSKVARSPFSIFVRGDVLAEVVEHHHAALDERRRVRDALARDVGRRAVDGLEDRALDADVRARDDAEPADEARRRGRTGCRRRGSR